MFTQHNFLLHYPNSAGASGPVTLEEIMLNSPDFNYTEGVSLVTDFFVLLVSTLPYICYFVLFHRNLGIFDPFLRPEMSDCWMLLEARPG